MNWNLLAGVIVSVAIHVAVVSCTPPVKTGSSTEGTEKEGGDANPSNISAYIENANTAKQENKGTGPSALSENCASKKFYTGIGVIMGLNGAVSSVALGGPADKAGVLTADIIVNSGVLQPDKYPVGYEIVLEIVRPHEKKNITVIIDKVCFE